jgi:tripartite-type tricarboxylate transporter receptor subunit TctC
MFCIAALLSLPAPAQNYPAKPVRLIIGFAPGGGTDVTARAVTQRLSEKFGELIVIDYRAGAAGTVGNAALCFDAKP